MPFPCLESFICESDTKYFHGKLKGNPHSWVALVVVLGILLCYRYFFTSSVRAGTTSKRSATTP